MASQLDPNRFHVTVVRCRGMFEDHCVVMESKRVELDSSRAEKSAVCADCRRCTDLLARSFYHDVLDLDDFSDAADETEADLFVAGTSAENYLSRTLGSLEIGRLSSYLALIKFKKATTDLRPEEFRYYLSVLRTAYLSFKASERLLASRDFDIVLTYSAQYSANVVCAELAVKRGLSVYFVEGSSNIRERYRALRVWSWPKFKMVNPALSFYSSDSPDPEEVDLQRVMSHFDEINLGRSHSVYSVTSFFKSDVRKIHGIQATSRILLATLSSYDEAFSALVIGGFPKEKFISDVFPSQFDWIESLIHWASERPLVHLVIRLHPRDFSNRRDSVVSEQSVQWATLLKDLPSNVSVDHPYQEIPIASYFPCIAALTTGWSATALEALMESIPVVTYDSNLPSYPSTIHYSGRSEAEYWRNLEKAMYAEHSHTIRADAIKWMCFNFNKGTVRVRGRVFDQDFVQNHVLAYYLVGAFGRFIPRLSRRLDVLAHQFFSVKNDMARLNYALDRSAASLYEE